MNYIKEIAEGKDVAIAALCDSLQISRATLYRKNDSESHEVAHHSRKPHNALCDEQRQKILDLLYEERFVDATPYDVYCTLLDEGKYISSIHTMYCVLLETGESLDRRN